MQPTALELEKQQRREIDDIRRGERAYREAMAVKDPSALPSGKRLMREIIPALTAAIATHQDDVMDAAQRKGGKRAPHAWAIQTVRPDVLAFLTLDACLRAEIPSSGTRKELALTSLAFLLAGSVKDHVEIAELTASSGRDPLVHLRKRYGVANRMTWSRWKTALGETALSWPKATRVSLGCALIRQMVDVAPDHFRLTPVRVGTRTVLTLTLTDATRAVMADVEERRAIAMPHYMPMTIRPLDWRYTPSQPKATLGENAPADDTVPQTGRLEGGYVLHKLSLVRTGRDTHTKGLSKAVSALDLEAINAVQGTGWAVNRWLYDVMAEAWASGQRLGGLEPGEMLPHAPMEDTAFRAMTPDARREYLSKKARVHEENARRRGRFNAIIDNLAVARELRDEPAIYYPHVKDFRHRIYPVPVRGPHPQGDDISKALIHFAEGKPLGATGEFWLCVRAANCAGKDKLSLEERVQWTFDNHDLIVASASHPLSCTTWTEMAEPWQFLATCHELRQVWTSSTSLEAFVSHLPIPMDGSCNGIQHLSALGLDPVGAAATNLRPGARQDIYAHVAARVVARVETDAAAGNTLAASWTGRVSRSTVKRAVMTTPYGVTARGIRDQLLADSLVPEGDQQGKSADYMRDCISEALSGAVSSAKDIMGWLQDCASRLGKAGQPLRWETPSGSAVEQAYHSTTETRIVTLCGRLLLHEECPTVTLRPSKQALASAPNVIHSFDAAHLSMTVVAGAARGISHWAMIHDSYGTHAANTQALAGVLREQFRVIYAQDWLKRLYDGFRAYAPHVEIPLPPARGGFDIDEVLRAEFFFS